MRKTTASAGGIIPSQPGPENAPDSASGDDPTNGVIPGAGPTGRRTATDRPAPHGDRFTEPPTDRSAASSADRTSDRFAGEPAGPLTDRGSHSASGDDPSGRCAAMDRPDDRTSDRSAASSADRTSDRFAVEPAGPLTDRGSHSASGDDPSGRRAAMDRPDDRTSDRPAASSADRTSDRFAVEPAGPLTDRGSHSASGDDPSGRRAAMDQPDDRTSDRPAAPSADRTSDRFAVEPAGPLTDRGSHSASGDDPTDRRAATDLPDDRTSDRPAA
ncbi:hypothetical protein ACWD00_23840, partial [Streptomyces viridiviolaceus]